MAIMCIGIYHILGFQAFSFLCTFVPGSKKTIERTFARYVPWNFCSMQHSLLGTFTPVELSFLGSEGSKNFCSVVHSLPWNFHSSGAKVPRTFICFHETVVS